VVGEKPLIFGKLGGCFLKGARRKKARWPVLDKAGQIRHNTTVVVP